MVIINDIYAFLNEIAPVRYQMDFDNAGFLVGNGGTAVKNALLALDITDAVIAEAIELRAQLIVSHHPLIFTPLRHATTDDLAGRKVLAMARHGISAICMHTNLDIADGGVNDALMAALGAEVTGGLEPAGTAADGRTLTCGRVGKLPNPMTMAEFLPYVAGRLHVNGLRYVNGGLPVERIAVCGGSGGNMLELAAAKGCDTFVQPLPRGKRAWHQPDRRRSLLHGKCGHPGPAGETSAAVPGCHVHRQSGAPSDRTDILSITYAAGTLPAAYSRPGPHTVLVRLMRRGRQNGQFFNLRRHCRPYRREYLHRRCRPGTHREIDLHQTLHGNARASEYFR